MIYFTNRRKNASRFLARCVLPLIRSNETFGFVFSAEILFVHGLFTKQVPVDPTPGGVVTFPHEGTAQEGLA